MTLRRQTSPYMCRMSERHVLRLHTPFKTFSRLGEIVQKLCNLLWTVLLGASQLSIFTIMGGYDSTP